MILLCTVINLLFVVGSYGMLETHFKLSSSGMEYAPQDENALLLAIHYYPQHLRCARACSLNYPCRIFDYDSTTTRCRLFEGDLQTVGTLRVSNSSVSRVGEVVLDAAFFAAYGQSCNSCIYSRYLMCVNTTCRSFGHTYWTGSICATQQLRGGQCTNASQCWYQNHTCLRYFQCGRKCLYYTCFFGHT